MPAPPAAPPADDRLYTPAEVAALFNVDVSTVTRWARAGKIPGDQAIRTPGGWRRYRADYIDSLLSGVQR